jgi:hypothetical protein
MLRAPGDSIIYNCDFDIETRQVALMTFMLRALTAIKAIKRHYKQILKNLETDIMSIEYNLITPL